MASPSKKRRLHEIEANGHTSPNTVGFPERILSYKWVINNAGIVMNNSLDTLHNQGLTSPTFCVPFSRNTWYLRLNESEFESKSWFSIYLCQKTPPVVPPPPPPQIHFRFTGTTATAPAQRIFMSNCTFSILNSKNEVKHTIKMTGKVITFDPSSTTDLSVSNFLAKDNLTEFLCDDSLTIQVAATLVCLTKLTETTHEACAIPSDDIRQQMRSLYEEELFTDITIQCGDKQFKAHKNILAFQSPVFKKLFQTDMTKRRKNSVEISDIDPLVASNLISFLYSGIAPNLETLARDLLMVANKYELPRLMAMCENTLKMEMTVANAVELLQLPDLHQAMELKKTCLEFIHRNATEIYKSDGWKQLKKNSAHDHSCSTLMFEIIEDCSEQHQTLQ